MQKHDHGTAIGARVALAAVAIATLAAPRANADSFRCGGRLISEGMSIAAIERRCGEPRSIERIEEPILARRPNGTTYQVGVAVREVWLYDRGRTRFPARVTVEDGVAVRIELLADG